MHAFLWDNFTLYNHDNYNAIVMIVNILCICLILRFFKYVFQTD